MAILIVAGAVWGPDYFIFYKNEYLQNKYLKEFAALEDAYRQDKNGGDTPEETLEMLVTALEKGDAGAAANLFVPEKRKEMKKQFTAGLKSGGVELFLLSVKNNKLEGIVLDNGYRYQIIDDDDDEVILSVDFTFNERSNRWLIESL